MKNYKYFILLIMVLEISTWLILYITIHTILILTQAEDSAEHSAEDMYSSSDLLPFMMVDLIAVVINTPILIANTFLIVLHSTLNYKGLTTYEYILQMRVRKARIKTTVIPSELEDSNQWSILEKNEVT